MIYFVKGEYVPQEEARVSVLDRGFLYGDSIYETLRARGGRILFWKDHLNRLRRSAFLLEMEIAEEHAEPLGVLRDLLRLNDLEDARARIIVTRGEGGRDQLAGFTPSWVITIEPFEDLTETEFDAGVSAILVSVRRLGVASLNPEIKSSNLLNNLLARREAVRAGAAEGILLNPRGFLAEGAHSNLFWLGHDRVLRTPALEVGILPGITREKVLTVARKLGIGVAEVEEPPEALVDAREIMLTSTSWEVLSITRYNGSVVGDGRQGDVARALREGLRRLYDDPRETA
jgi:branched-chain amino acid aminotransferase